MRDPPTPPLWPAQVGSGPSPSVDRKPGRSGSGLPEWFLLNAGQRAPALGWPATPFHTLRWAGPCWNSHTTHVLSTLLCQGGHSGLWPEAGAVTRGVCCPTRRGGMGGGQPQALPAPSGVSTAVGPGLCASGTLCAAGSPARPGCPGGLTVSHVPPLLTEGAPTGRRLPTPPPSVETYRPVGVLHPPRPHAPPLRSGSIRTATGASRWGH